MIGERLAEIRKDHGDRQADLAQKLHVTLYTVRSWEQEKVHPLMKCWFEFAVSIRFHPIISSAFLTMIRRFPVPIN